jgi:hypothetical protein
MSCGTAFLKIVAGTESREKQHKQHDHVGLEKGINEKRTACLQFITTHSPPSILQLYTNVYQTESCLRSLDIDSRVQNCLRNTAFCHFTMRSIFFVLPFTLGAALGAKDDPKIGDYHAPGRADRIFHKRAPRDLGNGSPIPIDCKGSESACNNACFYIRCLVRPSQYHKPMYQTIIILIVLSEQR